MPNSDFWAIIPQPAIGTLEIEIDGYPTYIKEDGLTYRDYDKQNGTISWTGNIRDGDGDVISYNGRGRTVFHVKVNHFDEESNEVITIDEGGIEAAYGGVLLSGTCEYPSVIRVQPMPMTHYNS